MFLRRRTVRIEVEHSTLWTQTDALPPTTLTPLLTAPLESELTLAPPSETLRPVQSIELTEDFATSTTPLTS
jgi:hypothetical protein